jgi:hypothetical protein
MVRFFVSQYSQVFGSAHCILIEITGLGRGDEGSNLMIDLEYADRLPFAVSFNTSISRSDNCRSHGLTGVQLRCAILMFDDAGWIHRVDALVIAGKILQ